MDNSREGVDRVRMGRERMGGCEDGIGIWRRCKGREWVGERKGSSRLRGGSGGEKKGDMMAIGRESWRGGGFGRVELRRDTSDRHAT